MPNHVQNTVTITGRKTVLDQIEKKMKGESDFDFNKLLPLPQELAEVVTGGCTIDGKHVTLWTKKTVNGEEINTPIPAATIARWRKLFGADNWYDWSIRHWGTKWNAYEVSKLRKSDIELLYFFDTAWSDPAPVFDALLEQFPTVCIEIACGGEVDHPYSYTLGPRGVAA